MPMGDKIGEFVNEREKDSGRVQKRRQRLGIFFEEVGGANGHY